MLAVASANPLIRAPFDDPDIATFLDDPGGREMEIRVGATPQGSGALHELRTSHYIHRAIIEAERIGQVVEDLSVSTGWAASAGTPTIDTVADAPTGYTGNSLRMTLASLAANATARITKTIPAANLSEYNAGTAIRIYIKASSIANVSAIRVRIGTATVYHTFNIRPSSAGPWVHTFSPKDNPFSTTGGAIDWAAVTSISFEVIADGTGWAVSKDFRFRALRMGTPVTLEQQYDVRVRYHDEAGLVGYSDLAAAAAAGATNLKVTNASEFVVGQEITLVGNIGGAMVVDEFAEVVTVTAVGTSGSGGTGLTVTPALRYAHSLGTDVEAWLWSPWSDWTTVKPSTAPTLAVVSPVDGATVTDPTPTLSWSFASVPGKAQAMRRVRVSDVVYDDGLTVHSDDFSTDSGAGLAAPDVGAAYTTTAGISASGGRAIMEFVDGTFRTIEANNTTRDTLLAVTFELEKQPAGNVVQLYLLARAVGTTYYDALIDPQTTGAINARIRRVVAGVATNLSGPAATGLTWASGRRYAVRFEVVGINPTTVRLKVWDASLSEPEAWTHVAHDASGSDIEQTGEVRINGGALAGTTNYPNRLFLDDLTIEDAIRTEELLHDSGEIAASDTTYTVPVGELTQTGRRIGWTVDAEDTDGLPATLSSTFITSFSAPAVLTGFTATANPAALPPDITLGWTASADANLVEYRVYRRVGTEDYVQIATVAAGITSYVDREAPFGELVEYQVTAYNGFAEGTPASASATLSVDRWWHGLEPHDATYALELAVRTGWQNEEPLQQGVFDGLPGVDGEEQLPIVRTGQRVGARGSLPMRFTPAVRHHIRLLRQASTHRTALYSVIRSPMGHVFRCKLGTIREHSIGAGHLDGDLPYTEVA